MKIWRGFASEHSANMVLIGHFVTTEDAIRAAEQLQQLHDLAITEFDYDRFYENKMSVFTTEPIPEMLKKLELYDFAAEDVEHLVRQHSMERDGKRVRIWTDESDLNGFLKFLIKKGAFLEVYSAHDYPEGRPEEK